MNRSRCSGIALAAVAWLTAPSIAVGMPSADGFTVETYADVADPTRLSFAPDGTLFTGRDNLGSGGGAGDSVKIHRIAPGGSPVVEYGVVATPDPDAVVVDVSGGVGGVGSVLTGGFISTIAGGRISEIATDESVTDLFSSTSFDNPSDLEMDSSGRLLFTNFANPGTPSGVFQSTGGVPTALFTTTSKLAFLALDPSERIFVSADDGTIRIYSSAGALIDATFATGMGGGVPIAIGAFAGLGIGVFTVNPSSELVHIDFSGTTTVVGTGFGSTSDLEFGPDGALYVAEFSNDRVLRMAPDPVVPAVDLLGSLVLVGLLGAASFRRIRRS